MLRVGEAVRSGMGFLVPWLVKGECCPFWGGFS